MILQPLVENSIKHGLSRKVGAGSITIRSHRENGRAVIEVEDDGMGFFADRLEQPMSSGIGLRQRSRTAARDLRGHLSAEAHERAGQGHLRAYRSPRAGDGRADHRMNPHNSRRSESTADGRRVRSLLKVLVVDDEQLARDELLLPARAAGRPRESSARRAMASKRSPPSSGRRPDLVLPGHPDARTRRVRGGAAPARPGTRSAPALVFVTAFDQHAIEAFEVNAVDYLLKPVEAGRLEQALERARRRVEAARASSAATAPLNDQLEQIVKMMADRQVRREQVAVKVGDRFLLVQADEIIFASLADESINIVTGQVAGTSNYRTLDDLQARLDPEVFWRVHRSHLVNIKKIKEIVPWFSRNYILRMNDAKGDGDPGEPLADEAAAGN